MLMCLYFYNKMQSFLNSHENTVLIDTLYLTENDKGEIIDTTYNCKWTVSKVDDSFYPDITNFNNCCKPIDGKITIPAYGIYKNRKYYLRNKVFTNVENINLIVNRVDESDLIYFDLDSTASLSTNDKICFKYNFFNKPGCFITYPINAEEKHLYSDSECKTIITDMDKNTDVVITSEGIKYISPHYKFVYTDKEKSSSEHFLPACKIGNQIKTVIPTETLRKYYVDPTTRIVEVIKYQIGSNNTPLSINVDNTKEIILSKYFNDNIKLVSKNADVGLVKVVYPKYNFTEENIITSDTENLQIHLYIDETYLDAGLGYDIEATENTLISHLWLSYLFFNSEDISGKDETHHYFGDFSKLTNLHCIHIPKEFVNLSSTATELSNFISYLKKLFNVGYDKNNAWIAFY